MTTPASVPLRADVFELKHAFTTSKRVIRAAQLGPKYFFWDVPRYLWHRRALGLPVWDSTVWVNPIREFRRRVYPKLDLPPACEEALSRLWAAGVRLTIPPAQLLGLLGIWWACRDVPGDVIECGSYRGANGLLLALLGQMTGLKQVCYLLDTYHGMPRTGRFDFGRVAGEFAPPSDQVEVIRRQAEVLGVSDRVRVCPGLFSQSFARLRTDEALRFAFSHIDANLYESTLEACEFVLPRMGNGGMVVFDDYNGVCDLGARLAIDRFFRDRQERPEPLAVTSAYVRCRV